MNWEEEGRGQGQELSSFFFRSRRCLTFWMKGTERAAQPWSAANSSFLPSSMALWSRAPFVWELSPPPAISHTHSLSLLLLVVHSDSEGMVAGGAEHGGVKRDERREEEDEEESSGRWGMAGDPGRLFIGAKPSQPHPSSSSLSLSMPFGLTRPPSGWGQSCFFYWDGR